MIARLFETQRPLMIAGTVSFALFAITAVLIFADATEILGINRWIKPMKFFISIAIFLWTIALYFDLLPTGAGRLNKIAWMIIAIFVIEMAVIAGQPLRGETSHFNTSSAFNGALFAAMGTAIATLTVIMFYVAYLYFRSEVQLPAAVVLGLRLGLVVMLLGSLQGAYMSSQIGHAVGVPDGGAGLPLVNWSTEGGDLRAAHFIGLHGLQAIPLFAAIYQRYRPATATLATAAFAVVYAGAFTAVFIQAVYGQPLLAIF